MTVTELASYIVSWTLRDGLQRQLDSVISASGLSDRKIDLAFDMAAERL